MAPTISVTTAFRRRPDFVKCILAFELRPFGLADDY